MDDQDIWNKLCRGDRAALETLYLELGARMRAFLRHYVGDAQAAEDAVQETFLQVWQRPNGFDPTRGTLKRYLFGIARKRAAQWFRDRGPSSHKPPAESSASGTGAALELNELLSRLEPDSRGLLWLREVDGYSYAELAEILNVPVGTVRSRLFAAREEIRALRQPVRESR